MSSISRVQTERVLSAVAHHLYATGVNPTLNEVLTKVSQYFSKYPAGLPLPFPLDTIKSQAVSDVVAFNLMLAYLTANIDVLYEVCLDQVDQVMLMSTILQADLDCLDIRRKRVETQIDDHLLSLYNTDGYYYSLSDVFSDTSVTDLRLTSAFVDTTLQQVVLPTISNLTKIVGASVVGQPTIQAWATINNVQQQVDFNTVSPFNFAVNGASNTVWEIQVIATAPSEIVVTVDIPLGTVGNPAQISRAEINPYGMTPIQVFAEVGRINSQGSVGYTSFGGRIESGLSRMSFVNDLVEVTSFRFTLRKTQYDYIDNTGNAPHYHYVFGAKEIVFSEQVYDNSATFVSLPLEIASDLQTDVVIDALSMTTVDSIPAQTSIFYYVAEDPLISATPSLGDFAWRRIEPVGTQRQDAAVVAHFNGAQAFQKMITEHPGQNDLQLVPIDIIRPQLRENPDINLRNPTPAIIPGVDVFILAREFIDSPLLNSLSLEEGINSTRIYWTTYNSSATDTLSFWGDVINGRSTTTANVIYGHIDTGHGFFYGGDVGQNGVSVYVETFLQLDSPLDPILAHINKADSNSQTWTIQAFLNGRSIVNLPGRNTDTFSAASSGRHVAQDGALVPFAFQEGLNHIGVAINIPPNTLTTGVENPYLGVLELPADKPLFGLGTVKLGDWAYVDLFDMTYNESGQPLTFTITPDGQIISRRPPSTNYRLRYNKATNTGPAAVRVRADLDRSTSNMHVTPSLSSYRVRFSYGTQA